MSPEYLTESIEAFRIMDEYAASLGLPEIDGQITFYLYNYGDELVEAYIKETGWSLEQTRDSWENGTAESGRNWIFVNPSAGWYLKAPREARMKVIVHELVHAGYQHFQSGLDVGGANNRVPDAGPRWLSEGSAEFLAYRAVSAGGVLSYQAERESKEPWGFVRQAQYIEKPLRELETWDGFSSTRISASEYSLMAAELLASHAGERALLDYYRRLQPGTTWQMAFEAAFGMTVDEFYTLFEERRAAGFPELEIPKSAP